MESNSNSGSDILLTDFDTYLLGEGTHEQAYQKLGAHLVDDGNNQGVHFAVWAPNARQIRRERRELMSLNLLSPLCALLYLAATGLQLLHLSQREAQIDRRVVLLSLAALATHAVIVWQIAFSSSGFADILFV